MKKDSTNRKFKDSVFQLLFSDKDRALELFNALENTDYSDPEQVSIETLSAVLYNKLVNDLAFSVAGRYIVLAEHQSTANENMPLRMLLYLARELEQMLPLEKLLKARLYQIPAPHFYVLYNGAESRESQWELKLSEAFLPQEEPVLELIVRVININESAGNPLLCKSPTLGGYSHLVMLTRQNTAAGMKRDDAIEAAIGQCIRDGVLSDFLKKHGAEVSNQMFKEITFEDALRIRGEEAAEEAEERGIKQGLEQGIKGFIIDYREEGFSEEHILEKLRKRFDLDEEKAQEYYNRFAGQQ